jgi:diaminopimelate decarboxylase
MDHPSPADLGALSIRDGRLHVEDCDATGLARRHGTPCYVVSEAQLRANARRIAAAFAAAWPHGPVALLPAFKAAPSLAVRAILNDEGLGCDAFGGPELRAALRAGVPGAVISLNGPRKDAATLAAAVAAGATVTLDDGGELDALRAAVAATGRSARVHLRLRPDYARITAKSDFSPDATVAQAAHAYKPGVPPGQAPALAKALLAEPGVELTGLMAHLGRHRADAETWALMAACVADAVAAIVSGLGGWTPRELDVGGGFPAPRDPLRRGPGDDGSLAPLAPPVEAIATAIGDALRDGLSAAGVETDGLVLQVEPGRSLHADTGLHLATVQGVKRAHDRAWVETDTSEQFLLDTLIEGNRWPVVVAARAGAPAMQRADLVGCSCGFDVLVADASLPEVAPGDVVALLDTGAYQESLATNFNALPRPATVLVSGARSEVIRRREREDEVFARDVVPERLGGAGGPASGHVARAIDHVSVTCASIDRSLRFYRDGLGMAVRERGIETDERIGAVVGLPGARLRFADLELGDGGLVELLEYESPAGRALAPQPNDAGAAHVALVVTDLDAALERLRAHGFQSRAAPVTLDDHDGAWKDVRIAYVPDPDGFVVELIERPDSDTTTPCSSTPPPTSA